MYKKINLSFKKPTQIKATPHVYSLTHLSNYVQQQPVFDVPIKGIIMYYESTILDLANIITCWQHNYVEYYIKWINILLIEAVLILVSWNKILNLNLLKIFHKKWYVKFFEPRLIMKKISINNIIIKWGYYYSN